MKSENHVLLTVPLEQLSSFCCPKTPGFIGAVLINAVNHYEALSSGTIRHLMKLEVKLHNRNKKGDR